MALRNEDGTVNKEQRMRVILTVIAIALCIYVLASCGQKTQSVSKSNSTDTVMPIIPASSGNTLVREDAEGLVQVRIESGEAVIWFDYDKWDRLYDIYAFMKEFNLVLKNPDIPFPIIGLSGKVRDACIGKIESLDLLNYQDFTSLTVFLLMEDGGVEWFYADPFVPLIPETMDAHWSMGRLPWMDGIESLSYESDNEGMGEMTIYAVDFEGRRFDLRIPWHFKNFFAGTWLCDLEVPGYGWVCAYLGFMPDGSVIYGLTTSFESPGEFLAQYSGSFFIVLAEEQEYRPGTIVFDMTLESISDKYGRIDSRHEIKGSYFSEVDYGGSLNLWLSDGDPLYQPMGTPVDSYNFGLRYDTEGEG